MKNLKMVGVVALIAVLASPVYAANRPVSMRLVAHGQTPSGEAVRHYLVTCSSGKKVDVQHYRGQEQWCLSGGANCQARKMSAAKRACKIGDASERQRFALTPAR